MSTAEWPTGTVTFLFTDIEGSTRLRQSGEQVMRATLSRHDELLQGGRRREGNERSPPRITPEEIHDRHITDGV